MPSGAAAVGWMLLVTMVLVAGDEATLVSTAEDMSDREHAVRIYFNELTGLAQLDSPDTVVEDAVRAVVEADPSTILHHTWIPKYSEEEGKWYYYNQRLYASQWEKPADLSWEPIDVFLNEL